MKKALSIALAALSASAVCVGAALIASGGAGTESFASEPAAYAAVLRQGARGGEVKEVQRRLKNWGYYDGSVDGIYGPATVKAVKSFQSKNGLVSDGICGKATYAALGMNDSVRVLENGSSDSGSGSGPGAGSSSDYTSSDIYLLARCIYGEARGESYTGQVAVGAVVLNRVKSSQFPNTISGVIYQKGAFTAVDDGQINLTPNQTAINAAQDAMNGWDPTYGCLYYYNPATATSSWIFSRQTVTTIGKHVFAI